MYVCLKKNKKVCSLIVAKLERLTNAFDFTIKKSKILNINYTQPAWTVTDYPMLNISFELT